MIRRLRWRLAGFSPAAQGWADTRERADEIAWKATKKYPNRRMLIHVEHAPIWYCVERWFWQVWIKPGLTRPTPSPPQEPRTIYLPPRKGPRCDCMEA